MWCIFLPHWENSFLESESIEIFLNSWKSDRIHKKVQSSVLGTKTVCRHHHLSVSSLAEFKTRDDNWYFLESLWYLQCSLPREAGSPRVPLGVWLVGWFWVFGPMAMLHGLVTITLYYSLLKIGSLSCSTSYRCCCYTNYYGNWQPIVDFVVVVVVFVPLIIIQRLLTFVVPYLGGFFYLWCIHYKYTMYTIRPSNQLLLINRVSC